MAKSIGSQLNLNRIPIIGLVPESRTTAPPSPVAGQLWYDTTSNRMKTYNGTTWVAGDAGDAIPASAKGAASGVASLDGGAQVPIAQIPTSASNSATAVPLANDARLSDQRVPTDGSVTGGTAGAGVKIAAGTITDTNVAAANKDGAVGTPSLRTLGTSATSAAAGNDARLSDTRVPTDGTVTGGTAGAGVKIAAATITDANIAAANKDGVAGTPSLRTLSLTSATAAVPGGTRLDQLATANPATASIDANTQRIINLAAPVGTNDAARLSDVQAAAAGIDNKPSARLVATSNISLFGTGGTFDGVVAATGDRVLATGQTTASQNGIYVVAAAAWARASDTVTPQAFWLIEEGTTYGGSQWKVSTSGTIVLGTTALTINQFAASGMTYTGTAARIVITGSVINIDPNYVGQNTITTLGTITTGIWSGTAIAVAKGGTGATSAAAARTNLGAVGKYSADLGALTAGSETTITHNLGTTDVHAMFRTTADGYVYELAWRVVDANTIGVTADIASSAAAVRVVVVG